MSAIIEFLYYPLGFVILLGVLVFIHELGHFLVAKAFHMRVETFSIGMGKKLFSWRRGETEYALSLIPLGGYVKISGQDPREELPPDVVARSFRTKPLYQRTLVVLAGPVFNAVLACIVFFGLYLNGLPSRPAVLDRVLEDSPAYSAGFRSGDRIRSIIDASGKEHRTFELIDLERVVGKRAGDNLVFVVQRKGQEESLRIPFVPTEGEERDSTIGVVSRRGIMPGVERSMPGPAIVVEEGSWSAARLLPSYFFVSRIEAKTSTGGSTIEVKNFPALEAAWNQVASTTGVERIVFYGFRMPQTPEEAAKMAEGPPSEESFTLGWTSKSDAPPLTLGAAGMRSPELRVLSVLEGSPAERMGLKPGDDLVSLGGQTIQSFSSFRDNVQKLATAGTTLDIEFLRAGKLQSVSIEAKQVMEEDPLTEAKSKRFQIGASFSPSAAAPEMEIIKAESLGEALYLSVDRPYFLTLRMLSSFGQLLTGNISPKTLGGPIMIAKISGKTLSDSWTSFLRMMAFISLNLFILNLLPIPVLDGGHLVLFGIEAIMRKPLPIRAIEIWSTVGFVILMSLIAVVFFNDLSRLGLFSFFNS